MLLTIVIPVYNTGRYLEECLNSIILQGLDCCEIILVNDGSTDNSAKICDDYAFKHNNITVVHQKNKGVSVARNNGISMANGEYITFVDSDDILAEKWLEVISKQIIKNHCDMITFSARYYMADGSPVDTSLDSFKVINIEELRQRFGDIYTVGIGSVCFSVYRTELIRKNKILFNEDKRLNEETFFNLKVFESIQSFEYIDNVLYLYRVHNESSSNKGSTEFLDIILEKVKVYDAFLKKTGFIPCETPGEMLQKGVFLQFLQAATSTNSLTYNQRVAVLDRIYKNTKYHDLLMDYHGLRGSGIGLILCRISAKLKTPQIVVIPCTIKKLISR